MPKRKIVLRTTFASYERLEQVGQGGAGRVFRVRGTDGAFYAAKILNKSLLSGDRRRRFKNEIGFCQNVEHPHIVRVLDHGLGPDGESIFYVMPFFPLTLRSALEDGLDPSDVLPMFDGVLRGIEAAHLKGVWHRDLKPENILLDAATKKPVVADFGIAHFMAEDLVTPVETMDTNRLANFRYAAPEQRSRGQTVDQRADIYALGLILNELYTGEVLQGTGFKTIASVAKDYAYLDALVERMVRQSPADRPQTIRQIQNELIGRRNEFVQRQKISRITRQVVPVTEPDDPLLSNPIRVEQLEDYDDQSLRLRLSAVPNQTWQTCFRKIGNHSFLPGEVEPGLFQFSGTTVGIKVPERLVQKAVDFLKSYVDKANVDYEKYVREKKIWEEQQARERLENHVKAEERRLRILQNTKV